MFISSHDLREEKNNNLFSKTLVKSVFLPWKLWDYQFPGIPQWFAFNTKINLPEFGTSTTGHLEMIHRKRKIFFVTLHYIVETQSCCVSVLASRSAFGLRLMDSPAFPLLIRLEFAGAIFAFKNGSSLIFL